MRASLKFETSRLKLRTLRALLLCHHDDMIVSDTTSQSEGYDCVLIDDDALIRTTWSLAAKNAGLRLLALAQTSAIWTHAPQLDRSVPIYVDYSLSRQPNGNGVIKQLVAAGFTRVYMETGFDAADVDAKTRSMITGISGKTPPWTKLAVLDSRQPDAKVSRS